MSQELDARRWEVLSAYLDGELDRATAAAVERDVRVDPVMADGLATLRRQRDALRDWASDVTDRPVPPAVRMLLQRARRDGPAAAGSGIGSLPKARGMFDQVYLRA